jgi:putative transposase
MPALMHMCSEVPPQPAVASVLDCLKGKSAMAIARQFGKRNRNFSSEHFWARGYAVSTRGCELEQVKADLRDQNASEDQGRFEADCLG